MAAQSGEDVYATLLLSDTYLPGALVLAHSLRDAKTTKKLAVLVTLDTVSPDVVKQLEAVFDYVIPVPRIQNKQPANLLLMNRTDLHSAFTKVNLWNQTQFRKIVYIDADVVAYKAPDELFELSHPFSAAPDIGWPDLFNTGVMVLSPNQGDYDALIDKTEKGISFDGADQGLLNMHFKDNFNRLSFSYNVTPSAHYQYVPAYRYLQSSINMVHFIGSGKPWSLGREAHSGGQNPYDEMVGKWWAVYDRHYGKTRDDQDKKVPEIIQYFVKGEFQPPTTAYVVPTAPRSVKSDWDAQRQSPPTDSRPEALNYPQPYYKMSSSTAQFVPPQRYPSPPRNMWYEVPEGKPAPATEKPKAIFPWEDQQPKASRVFAEPSPPSEPEPEPPVTEGLTIAPSETSSVEPKSEPITPTTPTIRVTQSDPWANFTRVNAWDDDPAIDKYVESIPLYRRHKSSGSVLSQTSPGPAGDSSIRSQQETSAGAEWRRRGSKLTDFPTAVERPSLPVTPAPVRRPKFWGAGGSGNEEEDDDDEQLPSASGVPKQSEWDPVERLQLLAQQQSNLLLQKLGASGLSGSGDTGIGAGLEGHDITKRSLPFGSEDIMSHTSSDVLSPQPVKPSGPGASVILGQAHGESASGGAGIPEPSYHGPGAAWEKDEGYLQHSTAMPPSEEERDVLET
ncbi:Glycogenin-1 [Cytospora mali]|uniref:glycogenin glucosyltransferase n=1 Tax=Cytospora mali TaxID=578113 RepID=A0A194W4R4_CYTMA|nr:Glycogenin-1 [Valsa mali]